eukprot:GAHX01000340.1.p1 GENE.GAHX01000340.1~~GAHX01000340.1.p1  ORF type:complete len:380 (-),score=64.41 GAHX01000340.1:124-1215(-)
MKSKCNGTVLAISQTPVTAFIRFENIGMLIYGLINGELIFRQMISNVKDTNRKDSRSEHRNSIINRVKLSFGVIEYIKYIGDTKLLYVYSQGCIYSLYLDIKNKDVIKVIDELDFQSFKRTKLVINFKNSFCIQMQRCFVMFVPSYSKIIKYSLEDNHAVTFDIPSVNKVPMGCVSIEKELKSSNNKNLSNDKLFVLFKREDLSGITLFIEEIQTCSILYKIDLQNNNEEKSRKKYISFQFYKDCSHFFIYFLDNKRRFYEFKLKRNPAKLEIRTIADVTRVVKISKDPILFYTMDIKNSFSLFMCRNNKIKVVDMKNFNVNNKYKKVCGKFEKFSGLCKGVIYENSFLYTCDDGIMAIDIEE